jgi:hypothetical protein
MNNAADPKNANHALQAIWSWGWDLKLFSWKLSFPLKLR